MGRTKGGLEGSFSWGRMEGLVGEKKSQGGWKRRCVGGEWGCKEKGVDSAMRGAANCNLKFPSSHAKIDSNFGNYFLKM